MFSPDGHWLAYASNASGRQEIYVRPYPIVQGTERRVSEGGGAGPVWAPDGSALYYRGATSLMVAPTPLGPGFVPAAHAPSSRLSDSGSPETRQPSTSIPMASGSSW